MKPTTCLEFLGIAIDSNKMLIRITEERLNEVYAEICNWYNRTKCSKRELLSPIGKLTCISGVVKPGRTFVRIMIYISKRVMYLHYTIHLNQSFCEDIKWWLDYLPSWNVINAFQDDEWHRMIIWNYTLIVPT